MSRSLKGGSEDPPPPTLNPEAVVIDKLVDPEITDATSDLSNTPKSSARSLRA